MPNDIHQLNLEHNGNLHLVTIKIMPKGKIIRVHTADGGRSAATSVRPPEPPEEAARWLLEHHKMFTPQN